MTFGKQGEKNQPWWSEVENNPLRDIKFKFYNKTQLHVYKIPNYLKDNGIIRFNE